MFTFFNLSCLPYSHCVLNSLWGLLFAWVCFAFSNKVSIFVLVLFFCSNFFPISAYSVFICFCWNSCNCLPEIMSQHLALGCFFFFFFKNCFFKIFDFMGMHLVTITLCAVTVFCCVWLVCLLLFWLCFFLLYTHTHTFFFLTDL